MLSWPRWGTASLRRILRHGDLCSSCDGQGGGLDDLLGEEGLKLSFPELGRKTVTKKKVGVFEAFRCFREGI